MLLKKPDDNIDHIDVHNGDNDEQDIRWLPCFALPQMQRDKWNWEQLRYNLPHVLWPEKQVWKQVESCLSVDYSPAHEDWMNAGFLKVAFW